MNELQIFSNKEFGEIRTVQLNSETYFVGKDVAEALGYERATKAIQDHVDAEDKDAVPIQDSIGRMQNTPVINESGLYSLILSSKLESAKRFKHWITSEVLPSVRKHGGYIAGQEDMSDEELLSRALLMAQSKIEERDKKIAEMKPKAIFADAVSASDSTILIRDLAKLIRQNGVKIGEKRLYKWLRENGYICKSSTMPTQKAMEMGLFEVIVRTIERGNRLPLETKTTKVTGKGQIYFVQKILAT